MVQSGFVSVCLEYNFCFVPMETIFTFKQFAFIVIFDKFIEMPPIASEQTARLY